MDGVHLFGHGLIHAYTNVVRSNELVRHSKKHGFYLLSNL